MIEGTTKSGFAFKVEETDIADDYELLDAICEVSGGNVTMLTKMVDMILGKEQRDRLKEHLRGINGRVKTTAMIAEVMEIFNLCGDKAKNS